MSPTLEHAAAYAVTAAIFALAYRAPGQRVAIGVLLIFAAGGLEFAHMLRTDRTASVADFLGSACGVAVGLIAAAWIGSYFRPSATRT